MRATARARLTVCAISRLLDQRRRHHHPGHVLREHAGARRRRRDGQLDLAHAQLPGHAVEQTTRGVAAARGDAVARGEPQLGEIAAHHLGLEAGDRRRDLEQDVPPLGREHLVHQRLPVEHAVLRLEGRQAARPQPCLAAVVELAADGAQLAHHHRFVRTSLLGQRLLQQRQARRRDRRWRGAAARLGASMARRVRVASSFAPILAKALASSKRVS